MSDLSFHVKRGEFFAFLGINGAGKSTTISVMCGELARDSGEVVIDGQSIDTGLADIRRKIGDKPGEGEHNYITNELGVGYRLNE